MAASKQFYQYSRYFIQSISSYRVQEKHICSCDLNQKVCTLIIKQQPSNICSKCRSLQFYLVARHLQYIMNQYSTNKSKPIQNSKAKLSNSDLHVKILNLVANRIQPSTTNLFYDKQGCGSCLDRTLSPSATTTKKNSLAATRANPVKNNHNHTIGQIEISQKHKGKIVKEKNYSIIPQINQKDKKHKKRTLQIVSKVINFNFQDAKIIDFTIDLRKQIPSQFINIKMVNKIKIDLIQKQRKIIDLQKQIVNLSQLLGDYKQALEAIQSQKQLQRNFSSAFSISQIGKEYSHQIKSEQIISQIYRQKKSSQKIINDKDADLLRLLMLQAQQIQQLKLYSIVGQVKNRDRAYTKPF